MSSSHKRSREDDIDVDLGQLLGLQDLADYVDDAVPVGHIKGCIESLHQTRGEYGRPDDPTLLLELDCELSAGLLSVTLQGDFVRRLSPKIMERLDVRISTRGAQVERRGPSIALVYLNGVHMTKDFKYSERLSFWDSVDVDEPLPKRHKNALPAVDDPIVHALKPQTIETPTHQPRAARSPRFTHPIQRFREHEAKSAHAEFSGVQFQPSQVKVERMIDEPPSPPSTLGRRSAPSVPAATSISFEPTVRHGKGTRNLELFSEALFDTRDRKNHHFFNPILLVLCVGFVPNERSKDGYWRVFGVDFSGERTSGPAFRPIPEKYKWCPAALRHQVVEIDMFPGTVDKWGIDRVKPEPGQIWSAPNMRLKRYRKDPLGHLEASLKEVDKARLLKDEDIAYNPHFREFLLRKSEYEKVHGQLRL
ncbi:hypothetical protein PENSPDRAFT_682852 [Peniophora sp. CONT]|nr:hypothetical protein PENSPDRAFT_682852 [Peniophora sp. CONT]